MNVLQNVLLKHSLLDAQPGEVAPLYLSRKYLREK